MGNRRGINSRVYEPGPYSEREALLWGFDEIVKREADADEQARKLLR